MFIKPISFKGEEGNIFYFVEQGKAIATKKKSPESAAEKVMEYNVGDYFGELALLKNAPRAANVIAEVKIYY